MSFYGDLAKAGINVEGSAIKIPGLGQAIGRGNVFYLDGTHGSASYNARDPKQAALTLSGVLDKVTTLNNDVIYVMAESTSIGQTAKVTMDESLTHIVGVGAFTRMNQRSRFGHSANFATMLDVTGYGNSFHNLYFMYGRGSATNTNLLTVTGNRNSFYNCHFGGPMHATEGATATFNLVNILGTENYFERCTFGISTIAVTAALNLVQFAGSGYDPRTIFRDCLFIMQASTGAASAVFLKTTSGVGEAFIIFEGDTKFINMGSQALTLAFDGAGTGAQKIFFGTPPLIVGATDVIAAAYEGNVYFPGAAYTAAATGNGLAVNADHTA
jgi:hypothetical protein